MKNKIDWAYLKKSLILFLMGLITAVGVLASTIEYESMQKEKYQQSLTKLRSMHLLYSNIINDIDLLEQYRNLYSDYKTTGLVGPERRLSWVESLESVNETLQLPNINYELQPQTEFNRPGFRVKRGVDVKGAVMNLKLGLLHEGDLFAFIEALRSSIKSIFTVESCTLTRLGGVSSSISTRNANLNADCQIRWITINAE